MFPQLLLLALLGTLLVQLRLTQSEANVALHKPAVQSSRANHQKAVDGLFSQDVGTCVNMVTPPLWWMVDLLDTYLVASVRITNRNGFHKRLTNFTVEITTHDPRQLPGFPVLPRRHACVYVTSPVPKEYPGHYPCTRKMFGRYVRIHKVGHNALTFCELEVLASPVPQFQPASASYLAEVPLQAVTQLMSFTECVRLCLDCQSPVCFHFGYHRLEGGCLIYGDGSNFSGDISVDSPHWDFYDRL